VRLNVPIEDVDIFRKAFILIDPSVRFSLADADRNQITREISIVPNGVDVPRDAGDEEVPRAGRDIRIKKYVLMESTSVMASANLGSIYSF
jgi:hypothetical protein